MNATVTPLHHAPPAQRSRSANALRKSQIQPYPMPNDECLELNKVDWPLDASDAVLLVHDMQQYWLDFFSIRSRYATRWSAWWRQREQPKCPSSIRAVSAPSTKLSERLGWICGGRAWRILISPIKM